MDDYPAFSLDHNTPLLVTLGVQSGLDDAHAIEPDLKEQAVLIRSAEPNLESDQAKAILRYLQDRDASGLPWNGRDTDRKYRFRVRTAARVCRMPFFEMCVCSGVLIGAYRRFYCLPAEQHSPISRNHQLPPRFCIPRSLH